ncbi:hypothetical protein CDAR_541451 [Caerostris darwini]|uniref:Uncharacterized protein n=1 Tax=Caerostris darwini TaxID=1538125 RepID=A0AAV4VWD5_9ARAC|nr:hypothetical protein CDAR_541451 [Caerostris darwini]
MEIRSTSTRIRQVGQKSENHRGTSPKSTLRRSLGGPPHFPAPLPPPGEDLNLHLAEALDRFIHREQSFFKAQLKLEFCGENSPSIFNQTGDNSTGRLLPPPTPSPLTVTPPKWKLEALR